MAHAGHMQTFFNDTLNEPLGVILGVGGCGSREGVEGVEQSELTPPDLAYAHPSEDQKPAETSPFHLGAENTLPSPEGSPLTGLADVAPLRGQTTAVNGRDSRFSLDAKDDLERRRAAAAKERESLPGNGTGQQPTSTADDATVPQ